MNHQIEANLQHPTTTTTRYLDHIPFYRPFMPLHEAAVKAWMDSEERKNAMAPREMQQVAPVAD